MRRATMAVAAVLAWWATPCQADEQPRPDPLPADVVAAWEKAGAETGWMVLHECGFIEFRAGGAGKEGELPAFSITAWREGILNRLPPPGQPFGLDIFNATVSDLVLKEVAGLKDLQALNLG